MLAVVRVPSDSSHARTRARQQGVNKRAELFTVFSTAGKFLAAKLSNSALGGANVESPEYLASATLRNAAKRRAKTHS
jgi:hypothetical protein